MSKTLLVALFLGAIDPTEAKIRPLYSAMNESTPIVKSHSRKVREPLVRQC